MRPSNKRRLRRNRKARNRPAYRRVTRSVRPKGRTLRTRNKYQRVKNVTGQLSFSSCSHSHRADSQVRKSNQLGAINQIVNQSSVIGTTAAGFQATLSYEFFGTAQLRQLLGSVSSNSPKRVVAKGLNNELTFTNFTNAPVEIDIYDLVLKRDMYNDYNFTTPIDTYIVPPYPESYWGEGLNAQAGVPTASQQQKTVGVSPTDSQLFKDWFVVKKRTTVLLPLGGAHRHFVTIKTNRIIDTMLAGNATNVRGLAGYTTYTMWNYKGLPVFNTTGGSGNVTTSAAQVGVVSVQRLKYTFISDYSYSATLTQGLPNPSALTTSIWNEGSGAIMAVGGLQSIP